MPANVGWTLSRVRQEQLSLPPYVASHSFHRLVSCYHHYIGSKAVVNRLDAEEVPGHRCPSAHSQLGACGSLVLVLCRGARDRNVGRPRTHSSRRMVTHRAEERPAVPWSPLFGPRLSLDRFLPCRALGADLCCMTIGQPPKARAVWPACLSGRIGQRSVEMYRDPCRWPPSTYRRW